MADLIHPFILAGGSGVRLWPLSRPQTPKPFLPLAGPQSLFQQTLQRVTDPALFAQASVVGALAHRALLRDQLEAVDVGLAELILEPVGCNTACAVAVAAVAALQRDPDALVLVLPSDHVITGQVGFLRTVANGVAAARAGRLVVFGVWPQGPATGYGYIKIGGPAEGGAQHVAGFIEKPDVVGAAALVEDGDHLWNCGVFLFSARTALEELERWAPAVLAAAENAYLGALRAPGEVILDGGALDACPSLPFDTAVMERTDRAAVVTAAFGWADVGSWSALWELGPHDLLGNVVHGRVALEEASGTYVRTDGPLVAAVGVEDLVIVADRDAVLVARRGADQDLRAVVARLQSGEVWSKAPPAPVGEGEGAGGSLAGEP